MFFDQALACPHCGRPYRAAELESTRKVWKFTALMGLVLMLVGLWDVVHLARSESIFANGAGFGADLSLPLWFAFGGLVVALAGFVGAWWNNG